MYFFWKGDIFSQMYPSTFRAKIPYFVNKTHNDVLYEFTCCEQWMMYNKAVLFNDHITAQLIIQEKNPYQIKKLGRLVKNFNPVIWDINKIKIVEIGNYLKFTQNKNMMSTLINTNSIIVEASPYDKIWGIGLAASDPRALDKKKWLGQNLLGYTLTKLRDYFKLQGDNVDEIISACESNDEYPML